MLETEQPRVQRLAREIRRRGKGGRLGPGLGTRRDAGAAIGRVADQGMAQMGQVHADLVRAAGLQPALDQRGDRARVTKGLDDAVARARLLAAAAQNRHALAVEGAAPDLAPEAALTRAR